LPKQAKSDPAPSGPSGILLTRSLSTPHSQLHKTSTFNKFYPGLFKSIKKLIFLLLLSLLLSLSLSFSLFLSLSLSVDKKRKKEEREENE